MTVPVIVHSDFQRDTPRTRQTISSIVAALAAQGVVHRTSGALVALQDLRGASIRYVGGVLQYLGGVPLPKCFGGTPLPESGAFVFSLRQLRSQFELAEFAQAAASFVRIRKSGDTEPAPLPAVLSLCRRLLASPSAWVVIPELPDNVAIDNPTIELLGDHLRGGCAYEAARISKLRIVALEA